MFSSDKLGRDKIKNQLMGVQNDEILAKMAIEKSRRFAFFLVRFWLYSVEKWSIGIYRKTGPTKSTVLGPGPPPWRKHEIYRFFTIFHDFGAFNRAGKSVSKIGIYALPPLKSDFYKVFINLRPNFFVNCSFLKYLLTIE
jgi:hypothetical protein